MIKTSRIIGIVTAFLCLLPIYVVHAKEWSLETDIEAGALYNDNIFLTTRPHDAVYGIIIKPTISGIVKEKHWQAKLNAMVNSQTYSDHTLDGNDQFFNLVGQYNEERNIEKACQFK